MRRDETIYFFSVRRDRARNEEVQRAYESLVTAFKDMPFSDARAMIEYESKHAPSETFRAIYKKALGELSI